MKPKVLLACPTYEGKKYALQGFLASIKHQDYENFDVLIVDNSATDEYKTYLESFDLTVIKAPRFKNPYDTLIHSRNIIRRAVLEGEYDYFFSLEQDMMIEPHTLSTLVAYDKKYVTTLVMGRYTFKGKTTDVPMVAVDFEGRPGKMRYLKASDFTGPLIEVKQAHLSCTLVHRDILEQFEFRHDNRGFDDTLLSLDMREANLPLWCDTTLKPAHRPNYAFSKLKREYRKNQK